MKLVSFAGNRAGVVMDDLILDVQAAATELADLAATPGTVLGLIKAGPTALQNLASAVKRIGADRALNDRLRAGGGLVEAQSARLIAPLPDPPQILAAGMNYTDHLEEMKTPRPSRPYIFTKAPSSVVGSGADILLPPEHGDMVDWEAELALIIGTPCHRVGVDEAISYVAAYSAANDLSARNWADSVMAPEPDVAPLEVVSRWGANLLGKQFPTFCPLGPVLITADEIPNPADLDIACRVNGETMQHNNTANMLFSSAELISDISRFHRLAPGDVILTGTMGGVGIGRSPRVFLKAGDTVEVEIEGIGVLRNRVRAAAAV